MYQEKEYKSVAPQPSKSEAEADCALQIIKSVEVDSWDRFNKIYHQSDDTTPLALIKQLVVKKKGDLKKDLNICIEDRQGKGELRFDASFTNRNGEVVKTNNLNLSVTYTYSPDHHYVKQKLALLLLERGSFYDDNCWELYTRFSKKMALFEKLETSFFESYDVEFKGAIGYEQLNANVLNIKNDQGYQKQGQALKEVKEWRKKIGRTICGMLNSTGGSFVLGVEDTLNLVQGVKFDSRKAVDEILLQIENHLLSTIMPRPQVRIYLRPIVSWIPGERPFKSHVEEMDRVDQEEMDRVDEEEMDRVDEEEMDRVDEEEIDTVPNAPVALTLDSVYKELCDLKTSHKELKTSHKELKTSHKELKTSQKELKTSHKELKTSHKVVCDVLDKFISDPSQMVKDRASLLNVFVIEIRVADSGSVYQYDGKSYIRNRGSTVALDFEALKKLVVSKWAKNFT